MTNSPAAEKRFGLVFVSPDLVMEDTGFIPAMLRHVTVVACGINEHGLYRYLIAAPWFDPVPEGKEPYTYTVAVKHVYNHKNDPYGAGTWRMWEWTRHV